MTKLLVFSATLDRYFTKAKVTKIEKIITKMDSSASFRSSHEIIFWTENQITNPQDMKIMNHSKRAQNHSILPCQYSWSSSIGSSDFFIAKKFMRDTKKSRVESIAEVSIAMLQVRIHAVHFIAMRSMAVKLAITTAFFSGDITFFI